MISVEMNPCASRVLLGRKNSHTGVKLIPSDTSTLIRPDLVDEVIT
jgi:hypothetical protein